VPRRLVIDARTAEQRRERAVCDECLVDSRAQRGGGSRRHEVPQCSVEAVHSRESGKPVCFLLGPRLRGDERKEKRIVFPLARAFLRVDREKTALVLITNGDHSEDARAEPKAVASRDLRSAADDNAMRDNRAESI